MSKEVSISATDELFLSYLLDTPSVPLVSEQMGITSHQGYRMVRRLKDTIQERARDQLTLSTLRAVQVMTSSLDATASLEKGELKLKAAAEILDRSGITKHTNVDVQIEASNGLFIIPAKVEIPLEEPIYDADNEDIEDGEYWEDTGRED